MTIQKKIQSFVELSTTKGKLDPVKIAYIAKGLTGKELKAYSQALLKIRKSEKVVVYSPVDVPSDSGKSISGLFEGKDIFFEKDSSLIAGLMIQFDDFLFHANIKHQLDTIKKDYDQE